jgi:hypothetical protein
MYFHALDELKDSKEFEESKLKKIDALLQAVFENGYHKRFSPRVYKNFKTRFEDFVSLEQDWVEVLEILSMKNYLMINFEINCSSCDAPSGLIYRKLSEIPFNSKKVCKNCGEEFIITKEDIYITYTFTDQLKPLIVEGSDRSDGRFFRDDCEESQSPKYTLDDYCLEPTKVFSRHVNEKRNELKECLNKVASVKIVKGKEKEKGDALEDLVEKLLPCPYLQLLDKKVNTLTDEIDLVYTVNKFPVTLFENLSPVMAVECKNWETKAPSDEVHKFVGKMNYIGANAGIFFSKKRYDSRCSFEYHSCI